MPKPIPEGFHTVTPYLAVKDASAALDFYTRALGAKERFRFEHGGKVGHAEMQIGDSIVMLSDGTARVKKDRNEVGTSVTTGEGNPLQGDAKAVSVTYNGQSCKA